MDKRRLLQSSGRELSDAVADTNALISFAMLYDPEHTAVARTLTAVDLSKRWRVVRSEHTTSKYASRVDPRYSPTGWDLILSRL